MQERSGVVNLETAKLVDIFHNSVPIKQTVNTALNFNKLDRQKLAYFRNGLDNRIMATFTQANGSFSDKIRLYERAAAL